MGLGFAYGSAYWSMLLMLLLINDDDDNDDDDVDDNNDDDDDFIYIFFYFDMLKIYRVEGGKLHRWGKKPFCVSMI